MGDLKDVAAKIESNAETLSKLFEASDKLMQREIDFARRSYGADPEKDGKANKDLNGDGQLNDKDNEILAGLGAERKGLDQYASIIEAGKESLRPSQQQDTSKVDGGSVPGPEVMAAINAGAYAPYEPASTQQPTGYSFTAPDGRVVPMTQEMMAEAMQNPAARPHREEMNAMQLLSDQVKESRATIAELEAKRKVITEQILKIIPDNGKMTESVRKEVEAKNREIEALNEQQKRAEESLKKTLESQRQIGKQEYSFMLNNEKDWREFDQKRMQEASKIASDNAKDWREYYQKQQDAATKFEQQRQRQLESFEQGLEKRRQGAELQIATLYAKKITIPIAEQTELADAKRKRGGQDLGQAILYGVGTYFLSGNKLEVGLGTAMSMLDSKAASQFKNGVGIATGILNSRARRSRTSGGVNTTPAVVAAPAVTPPKTGNNS